MISQFLYLVGRSVVDSAPFCLLYLSVPALPRLLTMYALALSGVFFAVCHALAEPLPGEFACTA
jgi:hypothetical protein